MTRHAPLWHNTRRCSSRFVLSALQPSNFSWRDIELLAAPHGANLAAAAPPPEGDAAHVQILGGLGHRKLGGRVGGAALAGHRGEDGVTLIRGHGRIAPKKHLDRGGG